VSEIKASVASNSAIKSSKSSALISSFTLISSRIILESFLDDDVDLSDDLKTAKALLDLSEINVRVPLLFLDHPIDQHHHLKNFLE
jgi:hypothetical protein